MCASVDVNPTCPTRCFGHTSTANFHINMVSLPFERNSSTPLPNSGEGGGTTAEDPGYVISMIIYIDDAPMAFLGRICSSLVEVMY